jgi:hypothetical protein
MVAYGFGTCRERMSCVHYVLICSVFRASTGEASGGLGHFFKKRARGRRK